MSDIIIPKLPGRLIRLTDLAAPMVIPPADDPPSSAFAPFPFPLLPLSMECWAVGLAEFFYGRYRRGLAVILTLHIHERRWTRPLMPTQECAVDGASFRLIPEDYKNLRDTRIAGSFQAGAILDVEESRALVPSFDGLHMIYGQRNGVRKRHIFLRAESQIRQVLPESVFVDDWRQFLHFHQDRLTME